MEDVYKQIASGQSSEIKIKGSRFIGEAILVTTVEEANQFLAAIKKRAYSATHHCWAYRIGADGKTFRFNDDGEPSGTAGQPILRQIDSLGVTNTMVVVTRYYGGTKLGKGGLIRAYGDAARIVLEECNVETKILRDHVRIVFLYEDTSIAMRTIQNHDAKIVSTNYHDRTEIMLAIRKSEVAAFKDVFVDNLGGRGRVEDC